MPFGLALRWVITLAISRRTATGAVSFRNRLYQTPDGTGGNRGEQGREKRRVEGRERVQYEKKGESMNMHACVRTQKHQEKRFAAATTTAATTTAADDDHVPDQIRQHVQPKQLIFFFHVLRRIGLHVVQPFVPRFLQWVRKWVKSMVQYINGSVHQWFSTSMVQYINGSVHQWFSTSNTTTTHQSMGILLTW
jgi:hypothetical protein